MTTPHDTDPGARAPAPYRPPVGIPMERPPRWGVAVSVLLHLLVLLLFLAPFLFLPQLREIAAGAGGPGAAGGGGGGRGGTGGRPVMEQLRYVQVAPPTPAPTTTPAVTPPVPVPKKPVPKKPEPPKPVPRPEVKPPVEAPPTPPAVPPQEVASALPGVGGGAGTDGSAGAGPGRGGGVGAGVGPGRGSGVGPGTGGGSSTVYPPVPDFFPLTPTRHPRVPGDSLVIYFTLDEHGNVLHLDIPSTGDRDFDREMHERYAEVKFRPATKGDGTPVAGRFPVVVRF